MVHYPPSSAFRSSRAVPPLSHHNHRTRTVLGMPCTTQLQWTLIKIIIFLTGTAFILSSLYLPVLLDQERQQTENQLQKKYPQQQKPQQPPPETHLRHPPTVPESPPLEETSQNHYYQNKEEEEEEEQVEKEEEEEEVVINEEHEPDIPTFQEKDQNGIPETERDNESLKTTDMEQPKSSIESVGSTNVTVDMKLTTFSSNESSSLLNVTLPPPSRLTPKNTFLQTNRSITITLHDLQTTPPLYTRLNALARGVSGLPIQETPALIDAKRATIACDVNVDFLAYWNGPVGTFDAEFVSPFAPSTKLDTNVQPTKYVTFENDPGGWNNIRMSMEIIVMFAVTTGRTLVLPPDMPLYLSNKKDKKGKNQRGGGDFFPLLSETMKTMGHLNVIRFEDFLKLEEIKNQYPFLNDDEKNKVLAGANRCIFQKKNDISCFGPYDYMRRIGYSIGVGKEKNRDEIITTANTTDQPFDGMKYCYIFDEMVFNQSNPSEPYDSSLAENAIRSEDLETIHRFCGNRKVQFYDKFVQDKHIFHFETSSPSSRMLNHYYSFFLYTNPIIGNHYKRFIRDFMHYHDEINCAAGKIVLALQLEAQMRGFANSQIDEEGGGGFSAYHIRRGDFQYKDVKITGQEWYDHTKELFPQAPEPTELIYIATDERNKTVFDDMAVHYELRYLDDYWNIADLGDLDPNYMGMIDTIVASRARVFIGTWFSTFTGYINRMRGYHGMTMRNSWYGTLNRKDRMQTFTMPEGNYIAREWPVGWVGIDGDTVASDERSISA